MWWSWLPFKFTKVSLVGRTFTYVHNPYILVFPSIMARTLVWTSKTIVSMSMSTTKRAARNVQGNCCSPYTCFLTSYLVRSTQVFPRSLITAWAKTTQPLTRLLTGIDFRLPPLLYLGAPSSWFLWLSFFKYICRKSDSRRIWSPASSLTLTVPSKGNHCTPCALNTSDRLLFRMIH